MQFSSSGMGFLLGTTEEEALPQGTKPIFSSAGESAAVIDQQVERIAQGCPELHILLFFAMHDDLLVEQMNRETCQWQRRQRG